MGVPVEVGRYVLHDVIAAGGMASVHLGTMAGPAGFSRVVAIKRLHPHLASDPKFVAMFVDEARLASRIHHPNVSGTLDVISEDSELLLVMELVRGSSLAELLRNVQQSAAAPPSVPVAVAIMVGALYGLHAAHEARDGARRALQIVHRDVSPHNVLVGLDGVTRVVDFGIAKAASRLQHTESGEVKGKLAYMAPEQLLNEAVDRRTDVYSASITLWEALTSERPHDAENAGALVAAILGNEIRAPSTRNVAVSPELDAIVLRGLARDPSARFPTALAMAEALARAVTPASPAEVGAWVEQVGGELLRARIEQIEAVERESRSALAASFAGVMSAAERRRIVEAPTGPIPAIAATGAPPGPSGSDAGAPTSLLGLAETTPVGLEAIGRTPTAGRSGESISGANVTVPSLEPFVLRRATKWVVAAILLAAVSGWVAFSTSGRRPATGGENAAGTSAAPPSSVSAAPESAPPRVEPPEPIPMAQTSAALTAAVPSATDGVSSVRRSSRAPRRTNDAPTPTVASAPSQTPTPDDCDPPYIVDDEGIKRFKRWCRNTP